MQGIYVNGHRPKSKREVRDAVIADPSSVRIEGTELYGRDYDGRVSDAPVGAYLFVGPDPYRARKFYGTVEVRADGTVRVK